MQRVLFVLVGLMAAMAVVGLAVAFTRPFKWPANVRALEWRPSVDEVTEEGLEKEAAT